MCVQNSSLFPRGSIFSISFSLFHSFRTTTHSSGFHTPKILFCIQKPSSTHTNGTWRTHRGESVSNNILLYFILCDYIIFFFVVVIVIITVARKITSHYEYWYVVAKKIPFILHFLLSHTHTHTLFHGDYLELNPFYVCCVCVDCQLELCVCAVCVCVDGK